MNKASQTPHRSADNLIQQAHRLDGRNYGSYKQLRGSYAYDNFDFHIHRVQADPYAPPSACSITVGVNNTGIPHNFLDSHDKRIAVADFLARSFAHAIRFHHAGRDIFIARCGQEILERSSVFINTAKDNNATSITLRCQVSLPARGRRILGHAAAHIFNELIPDIVASTCNFIDDRDTSYLRTDHPNTKHTHPSRIKDALHNSLSKLLDHINAYLDYQALQRIRKEKGWVAFIANDAVLARESGISDKPMRNAVPFQAPLSLAHTVQLPHAGSVTGMAIPAGVSVIVGGGYHGKSTLLQALERAVYAHIPDDGRERVVCDPLSAKVRAEDGRAVTRVDISRFIRNIPSGKDTSTFSTDNASGSTSQAAYICEVLEAGASTLLIDEDTSATNLMIRDDRMKQLVKAEPITPFMDRVRDLFIQEGVSTILVMGGSGDYLDVADHVILLQDYRVDDVSDQARALCQHHPGKGDGHHADSDTSTRDAQTSARRKCDGDAVTLRPALRSEDDSVADFPLARVTHDAQPCHWIIQRKIDPGSIREAGKRPKTKSHGLDSISLNRTDIDISAIEQIMDPGQAEAIAWALRYICSDLAKSRGGIAVFDALGHVEELMNSHGLDALSKMAQPAFLARPRRIDIASALNRLRTLNIKN